MSKEQVNQKEGQKASTGQYVFVENVMYKSKVYKKGSEVNLPKNIVENLFKRNLIK